MKFSRGLRCWHVPLLYLVSILMLAAIWSEHDEPGFLGPYLLLFGEFLAGVLVLRFGESGKRLPHLAVVAFAICGTFVVLSRKSNDKYSVVIVELRSVVVSNLPLVIRWEPC